LFLDLLEGGELRPRDADVFEVPDVFFQQIHIVIPLEAIISRQELSIQSQCLISVTLLIAENEGMSHICFEQFPIGII
jgi:hypothetical protein